MPPKIETPQGKSRFNRWGKRKKRTHLSAKKRSRTLLDSEDNLTFGGSSTFPVQGNLSNVQGYAALTQITGAQQQASTSYVAVKSAPRPQKKPKAKGKGKRASALGKTATTKAMATEEQPQPDEVQRPTPDADDLVLAVPAPVAVRRSYMGRVKPARQFEVVPGRSVGEGHPCFVIAEIGQNHQGNISIAKELIRVAKNCGADCVKFQKSNLQAKFTQAVLQRPYYSAHSFGPTYGEHKRFLEFSEQQYIELQNYAKEIGILFTASPMDEVSLEFLVSLQVPFIKIGSGDANNYLLLEKASGYNLPIFYSTGMQTEETVRKAYDLMRRSNNRIAVLQCTSSYPTPYNDVHLNVIDKYQKIFPDAPIGYSGHEYGTAVSLAAVALGASIIERHITLDKTWKGNDHACSLTPNELRSLIEGIRQIEASLGNRNKDIQTSEEPCIAKLGKTVVAARNLKAGTRLVKEDLAVKVNQPLGWPPQNVDQLIGKKLLRDVEYEETITQEAVTMNK